MASIESSKRLHKPKFVRRSIPGALAVLVGVGCGDTGGASPGGSTGNPGADQGANGSSFLMFYSGTGKDTRRVIVEPVKELASLQPTTAQTKTASLWSGPGLSAKTEDGGVVAGDPYNIQSGDQAWVFVKGALLECGAPSVATEAWTSESQAPVFYFLKDVIGSNCDGILNAQQTLVCAASKLADLADATGATVWQVNKAASNGMAPGPWTVPPQATMTRFALRDLAVHTLGHVVWADRLTPISGKSCAQLYGEAASNSTNATTNKSALFGAGAVQKGLPLQDVTLTDQILSSVAAEHLRFKTHVLQAAARMLPDLVQDGVYADIAGAAERVGHSGDLVTGQQILWGKNDIEGGYNTLAHAARFLGQRWQRSVDQIPGLSVAFGLGTHVGTCSLIAPMDALKTAYGKDFDSRVGDYPVVSEGQNRAVVLLESTAAIPTLAGVDAPSDLRTELIAQSQYRFWLRNFPNGVPSFASFKLTASAKSFETRYTEVSDADLVFAARHLRALFHTMTKTSDGSADDYSLLGSLYNPSLLAPGATGMLVALEKPLPRTDLIDSRLAKVGGLQVVSQCTEAVAYDDGARGSFKASDQLNYAMQDVFSMGKGFYGRLVIAREAAQLAAGTTVAPPFTAGKQSLTPAESAALAAVNAAAAAAEARTWSGEGKILASREQDSGQRVLKLGLVGFERASLGMLPEDTVPRIAVVWGSAQDAECVAGLRTACRSIPATSVMREAVWSIGDLSGVSQVPEPETVAEGNISWKSAQSARPDYGSDGMVMWGTFDDNTDAFHYLGSESYVVLLADPASQNARGKVLGTIGTQEDGLVSIITVSSKQAELYDALFGVNTAGLQRSNRIGYRSLAQSNASCIAGVPSDIYVPLENELTSDSDQFESSWKHYLDLAESASRKADELGDKMLDEALKTEMRREGANQELAEICGSYSNVGDIKIGKDGKPIAGPGDQSLKSCLGPQTFDVVFLGEAPKALQTQPDQVQKLLKDFIGCEFDAQAKPLPGSSQLCSRSDLEYAALGIKGVEPKDISTSSCLGLIGAAGEQLEGKGYDGQSLADLSASSFLSVSSIQSLLNDLILRESIDSSGEVRWELLASKGGAVLMSNQPGTIWPGCRADSKCDYANQADGTMSAAAFYELVFGAPSASLVKNVRWQVEGALWFLGSLVGGVPEGLFDVPVPVANFNAFTHPENQGNKLSLLASYLHGRMTATGDYDQDHRPCYGLSVSGNNEAERSDSDIGALSCTTEIPAGNRVIGEMPYWLMNLWHDVDEKSSGVPGGTGLPGYLMVRGKSEAMIFGDADAQPQKRIAELAHGLVPPGVSGLRCERLYVPSWGTASEATKIMRKLKTDGSSWQNVCSRPAGTSKGGFIEITSKSGSNDADFTFLDEIFSPIGQTMPWVNFGRDCGDISELKFPAGGSNNPGLSCLIRGKINGANYDGIDHSIGPRTTWSRLSPQPLQDNNLPLDYGRISYELPDAMTGNPTVHTIPVSGERFGGYFLSPATCGPNQRARLFVNSYAPSSDCDTAVHLLQGVGLACAARSLPRALASLHPPEIEGINNLPALSAWIQSAGKEFAERVSGLYVQNVPKQVVEDFRTDNTGSGSLAGKLGQTSLEMGKNLRGIDVAWRHVGESFQGMGRDIDATTNTAEFIELQKQSSKIDVDIARWESRARALEAIANAVGSFVKFPAGDGKTAYAGNPLSASLVAGVEVARAAIIEGRLDRKNENIDKIAENQKTRILLELDGKMADRFSAVLDSFAEILNDVASQKQSALALEQAVVSANYLGAQAAGADFYRDASGKIVELPVNTVMNNMYSTTAKRYAVALKQSRYLAFLARTAIEQRIGARLDSVSFPKPVGALDAPSLWANDLCNMTGIDYKRYRTAAESQTDTTVPDAGTAGTGAGGTGGYAHNLLQIPEWLLSPANARKLLGFLEQSLPPGDLSKQYIGDYVAKLREFVEYYNVDYPSHEGDDTAVLSLRDDLVGSNGTCLAPSNNLLLYSGDLRSSHIETTGTLTVTRGWRRGPHDLVARRTAAVYAGELMRRPAPPADAPTAGVSFLREEDMPAPLLNDAGPDGTMIGDDAGDAQESIPGAAKDSFARARSTYQVVHLDSGSYILSWWDSSRNSAGDIFDPNDPMTTATQTNLSALVVDSEGQLVSVVKERASLGTEETPWGPRRSHGFHIAQSGDYAIAFVASDQNEPAGNVAIAGVQLEKTNSEDAKASHYVQTASSRLQVSDKCGRADPSMLQRSFSYGCEGDSRCYYELVAPFVLRTSNKTGQGNITKNIALGNFNYRQISVGVNMVGTGLVDCANAPSSGCYGNGTIDYDMSHNAFEVEILGWDNVARGFNFGEAYIHGGRGLASERYITTPISSVDNGMLSQEGITKGEYRGRPIDGSYKIKIWDRPGLRWDRLEDIQLVMKYRYWSAIKTKPASN